MNEWCEEETSLLKRQTRQKGDRVERTARLLARLEAKKHKKSIDKE